MQRRTITVFGLAAFAAACSGKENTAAPPRKESPPAATSGATEVVLERSPVAVARGADGKCDWTNVDMAKANGLVEKYKGAKPGTILRLERNESTCTGNLKVEVVPIDPSIWRRGKKDSYTPQDMGIPGVPRAAAYPNGFYASFVTCAQSNNYPLELEYVVMIS